MSDIPYSVDNYSDIQRGQIKSHAVLSGGNEGGFLLDPHVTGNVNGNGSGNTDGSIITSAHPPMYQNMQIKSPQIGAHFFPGQGNIVVPQSHSHQLSAVGNNPDTNTRQSSVDLETNISSPSMSLI